MQKKTIAHKLMTIYRTLERAYGPQHWWPGDTPFEVMVGAVLTQNTAWSNVEKAIANLKRERLLSLPDLHAVPPGRLSSLIRPSGYYNIKAKRLRNLLGFIKNHYRGNLKRMFADDPETLRGNLLGVNGIGPETADSILLYAAGQPVFVVDAYTRRVFSRHGFLSEDASYDEVRRFFMDRLPPDARLYNEYHALIVRVGKESCKRSKPACGSCPLGLLLPWRRG